METMETTQEPVLMLPAYIPVIIPAVLNEENIMPDDDCIQVIEKPEEEVFEIPDPITEIVSKILVDGIIFKEIFGSIASLTPEVKLNLNAEGLTVKAVDVANVAMVDLEYKKGIFESFSGPNETVKIGIDIAHIYGLRTMIKKGSLVLMEFIKKSVPAHKEKNKDKIVYVDEKIWYNYNISIEGTETKDKALDINTIRKEPNPPIIDLKTSIDLKADNFIQGIKDGSKVSDKVALLYDMGNFSMIFEGDSRKMNKIVPILSSKTLEQTGRSRSLFSIDYLKDIVKTLNKNEVITLNISNDHPMKLTRENELRTVTFLLAPRIETN